MGEKKKILAIVERGKGKRNFACFTPETIGKTTLIGTGSSAREAMEDIKVCLQESIDYAAEKGETFPDVEFDYRFDVGSFFDYYPLDVTAFAKYIGMNASVLRQYVTALRQPKQDAIDKIRQGIIQLSEDLGANLMLEHPAASYVK